MKLKQKMFIKIYEDENFYLDLLKIYAYEDFYLDKDLFDFCDYRLDSTESDSQYFDSVNKKVIEKIKDEFKGKIISEFVGLKSKMYY